MFSIPHLIIVFVVALVVFGPEKLPELARNFGKLMGEFRRATGDLRSTFEGHLRDLEREAEQRRIGGSTTSPAVSTPTPPPTSNADYSASSAAAEAEISTALGAAGTVPTTPPHLGIGTPVSEPASAETATEQSSPSEPTSEPAADRSQQPPALNPEHNPESLTDAGTHPA
jgi:sec-independent protein translocase protein TatB